MKNNLIFDDENNLRYIDKEWMTRRGEREEEKDIRLLNSTR
jgi:hypothetical protein